MKTTLKTADDVVAALGGTVRVAKLFSLVPSAVSNWRRDNRFPPKTFRKLQSILRKNGEQAPDHLWGWDDAA